MPQSQSAGATSHAADGVVGATGSSDAIPNGPSDAVGSASNAAAGATYTLVPPMYAAGMNTSLNPSAQVFTPQGSYVPAGTVLMSTPNAMAPVPVLPLADLSAITSRIDSDRQEFMEAVNMNRLKLPEPGIFYGDPLMYPDWNASFTELVDNRIKSPQERMGHLKNFLGGEAKEAVDGFFLLRSSTAYDEARKKLEERYGNPFIVAEAFLRKLENWPKVNTKDPKTLRKFSDFLNQLETAMTTSPELSLNSCRENRRMLTKLPDYIIKNRPVACSSLGVRRL